MNKNHRRLHQLVVAVGICILAIGYCDPLLQKYLTLAINLYWLYEVPNG